MQDDSQLPDVFWFHMPSTQGRTEADDGILLLQFLLLVLCHWLLHKSKACKPTPCDIDNSFPLHGSVSRTNGKYGLQTRTFVYAVIFDVVILRIVLPSDILPLFAYYPVCTF